MFDPDSLIVGLEIGTSKICAVVGEVNEAGALNLIGIGQAKSRGVRKGEVADLDSTAEDIRVAIVEAEKSADVEIRSVFLGVTGSHIRGFNNLGVLQVVSVDRAITPEDVQTSGRLSWRDKGNVRAIIAEKNRVILEAYERARERHQACIDLGQQTLKDRTSEWARGKAAWDGARDREADMLRSLIALLERPDAPDVAAREILRRLAWPAWMPPTSEIRFDRHTRTLIVEHELPDLDEASWVRTDGSGSNWSRNKASEDEAAAAAAELYPVLTYFLARTLAGQMSPVAVHTIAVNGWCAADGKWTDTPRRVYCASLLVSAARLREIERQVADPVAAFQAAGGAASLYPNLNSVTPALRASPNDYRFIQRHTPMAQGTAALAG